MGSGLRFDIREQRKIKKKIKTTNKPLMANLDITPSLVLALRYNISHMKLLHSDTHRIYNPNRPLSLQLQTQVLKTVEYTS